MSEYTVHMSVNVRSEDGFSNFAIIETQTVEMTEFAELDALLVRMRKAIREEN
jgi:hypothetical protein